MSRFNVQVNTIAYEDINPSQNPQIRNFDIAYKLLGMPASEPVSEKISVLPNSEVSVFNGTRSTLIDGTTEFQSTQPDPQKNIYRFSSTGGTSPAFRTDRVIGIDNTTEFQITANGPISTLTNIAGTAIDTTNIQVGDIINIFQGSGCSVNNQGRFIVAAKTSNSISYQNLSVVAETFTVLDSTKLLVYSNGGSSNQVQIGDKVVISQGFSSYIFGTYVVSEVTPLWFEAQISLPNGIPLQSSIIPTSSGLTFYSSAKKFIMIAAQNRCSVKINGLTSDVIELIPNEADNPEKPALFMHTGLIHSLSVKNLSVSTLQILVASIE